MPNSSGLGAPRDAELLVELLADGGQADALRQRAAEDVVTVEDLAELLADRGCVAELRDLADGGNPFAAERLAFVLGSLGREEELLRRVETGDPVPASTWIGCGSGTSGLARMLRRLAGLRAAADRGDEDAAAELTSLLFDARDQKALLTEVNAGTHQAAQRYLALLTADAAAGRDQIRQYGLRADGYPAGRERADDRARLREIHQRCEIRERTA